MSQRLGLLLPNQDGAPTPLPERGRLTIGSSSERAKLVLSAQGVAEVHCIIARTKDGGWAVQDMGSDFGTMLDGERVDVARLRAGQTLLLGSVSISVVALAGEQASPTSPTPAPTPAKKASSAPTSPPPAPAAAAPAVPKKSSEEGFLEIPGYSIQETLGRGGMGAACSTASTTARMRTPPRTATGGGPKQGGGGLAGVVRLVLLGDSGAGRHKRVDLYMCAQVNE